MINNSIFLLFFMDASGSFLNMFMGLGEVGGEAMGLLESDDMIKNVLVAFQTSSALNLICYYFLNESKVAIAME